MQRIQRRSARVSEAQWSILLDFLERYPNLARARGYNNTARGRAESSRQWSELAGLLNAEGSGTAKTPKDWSVYVSNYKSKLKKIVAGINTDANRTGGGPPSGDHISGTELRFLSLMGQGFGQNDPAVAVNPLHAMDQPSTTAGMQQLTPGAGQRQEIAMIVTENMVNTESGICFCVGPLWKHQLQALARLLSRYQADTATVSLPRRPRQTRYRSRPLAPLDDCLRVLSQVELQRAAADRANARANQQTAQNLGRLADLVERYLSHIGVP